MTKKRRTEFKVRKGARYYPHGLVASNFPRGVQWKLDQDYVGKLSQEEREWLAKANDAMYGHKFREGFGKADAAGKGGWTEEQRAESYYHDNAGRRDALFITRKELIEDLEVAGEALPLIETPEDGLSLNALAEPTPEYLNTDEYKAALAEFRKTLKVRKKPVNKVKQKKARNKLHRVIPHPVVTESEDN